MSSSSTSTPTPRTRRMGVLGKIAIALFLVSLVPLAVTAVLVGNLGEVAQGTARRHVEELRPHLERAQDAYRELIASKKEHYEELARRLAAESIVRNIALPTEGVSEKPLASLLDEQPDLVALIVKSKDGSVLAEARNPEKTVDTETTRMLHLRQAVGLAGAELLVEVAADMQPVRDLQDVNEALEISKRIEKVETSLPRSYRLAFLTLIGAVVLAVTFLALIVARRINRRINALVSGTRQVATGDLEVRLELAGHDELAELASAFNGMVSDLQADRQKILYLQRIGAWQDVARRLAHEIKNPLTPIQLAVQQVVSSYEGEDEKYRRLLASCDEIVREEVESLRRLVDAFRDLGRLPKVEAARLPLTSVLDDLRNDPNLSELTEIVGDGDEDEVAVSADRLLLRRTLANLVENGIQAGQGAGADGRVQLSWRRLGDRLCFVIDDEGPGVPDAKREQIFDPYVTTKETGTGLGLAIAKKIALDHRGNLRLEAERAPLGGARFVLEIPLAADSTEDM